MLIPGSFADALLLNQQWDRGIWAPHRAKR